MTLLDNPKTISCLTVSKDQKYLISGNYGGIIQVYDYTLFWLKFSFPDHTGRVLSVSMSNDSRICVSSGADGYLVVRNLVENKLLQKVFYIKFR